MDDTTLSPSSLADGAAQTAKCTEADEEKDLERGTSSVSHDTNPKENNANDPTTNSDPNIVDFDGPDDLENPMNWPLSKKAIGTGIVSLITLLTFVTNIGSFLYPLKSLTIGDVREN
jgi:hypothetical protein